MGFCKWCHAPRERVSWNVTLGFALHTMHASRSTWACELKSVNGVFHVLTSCHAPRERVSWNLWRILQKLQTLRHAPRERVSWNIETCKILLCIESHAPRERVSWNLHCWTVFPWIRGHAPRERVSWNAPTPRLYFWTHVTLHVSVWVEIFLVATLQL